MGSKRVESRKKLRDHASFKAPQFQSLLVSTSFPQRVSYPLKQAPVLHHSESPLLSPPLEVSCTLCGQGGSPSRVGSLHFNASLSTLERGLRSMKQTMQFANLESGDCVQPQSDPAALVDLMIAMCYLSHLVVH